MHVYMYADAFPNNGNSVNVHDIHVGKKCQM